MSKSILKFDINYFDNINSFKKAYWLGFLSADGSLKNNKVQICLSDRDHIEKFKEDLKSEHKISINNYLDKRTNKIYTSYSIQITNKLFTNKLTKYIPINKSDNFDLPNIKNKFLPYFLAGMMDGDGSFTLNKSNYLVSTIISTKECLSQIQDYLLKTLGINKTKLIRVTENKPNVWKLYIYKGSSAFLNHIYNLKYEKIYLTRKIEKYKKIKKCLIENPNKKGLKRRPIKVFDKNGLEIITFPSIKKCIEYYKISTSTLFNRLKDGKPYKDLIFIGQEIIKY